MELRKAEKLGWGETGKLQISEAFLLLKMELLMVSLQILIPFLLEGDFI